MSPSLSRVLIADFKDSDISGEIPFLFHRAGCHIDVYCSPHSWLRKSRYAHAWYPANTKNEEEYVTGLESLTQSQQYDWVVLTDDFALRVLTDHLSKESDVLSLLPLTTLEHRAVVGSKAELSRVALQHGLRTPRFVLYEGDDAITKAIEHVPFPMLLKVDRSGGGKGIFRCENAQEIEKVVASLSPEQLHKLVFQEYIVGDNIAVEALFKGGVVYAYTYATVTANMEDEFGISAVRIYQRNAAMHATLSAIGSVIGIRGFCSLTFMRDASTGEHYLIEADMRPHAWFALSRFAGVNFSKAIENFIEGNESTLSQPATPEHIEVRHFLRDVRRTITDRNILELARWCLNSKGRWNYIPLHDTRLFLWTLESLARSYLYRIKTVRRLVQWFMRYHKSIKGALRTHYGAWRQNTHRERPYP
mgnify:FL=1